MEFSLNGRAITPPTPSLPWQPGDIPRIRSLTLDASGEVVCSWRYADMDEAIRALLCSAGGARAARRAGVTEVRQDPAPDLARFQNPQTGTVTLDNTFRWVAAHR